MKPAKTFKIEKDTSSMAQKNFNMFENTKYAYTTYNETLSQVIDAT